MIWIVRIKRPRKYCTYRIFIRESRAKMYMQRALREKGVTAQIKHLDWDLL